MQIYFSIISHIINFFIIKIKILQLNANNISVKKIKAIIKKRKKILSLLLFIIILIIILKINVFCIIVSCIWFIA